MTGYASVLVLFLTYDRLDSSVARPGLIAGGLFGGKPGQQMREARHRNVGLCDGGKPDGFETWAGCPLSKIFIRGP